MALHNNFLLLIFIYFFLSSKAFANIISPTLSLVSYISSTPKASPQASSPQSSNNGDDTAVDQTLVIPQTNTADVSVNKLVGTLMASTMSKTEDFVDKVVEKRIADTADAYKKECLLTCKEVYEDAVYAMKKTLEDLKDGNYYKANIDISAMSTNIETCKECVTEIYGEDPEFDKFDTWAQAVAYDALSRISSVSS